MNSKLKFPEVVDAYTRLLQQARYKAVSSRTSESRKKYEGLVCLYESTIHYLTNRITNR